MPQTGQLWYTTNAGGSDTRVARIGSDGLNPEIESSNTSTTQLANSFAADVGVDTVAGFYFALMSSGGQNALLYRGVVGSNAAPTLVVDFPDNDLINCIQVDPINHRIYVGQQNGDGDQPATTGIRAYSYDETTGALTDLGFISTWTTSGRTAESGYQILDPRDFALDPDSGTLFYTENLYGGVQQMGLFRMNMATGVHTQVFSESQFPNDGSNGFIADVEIDPSTDLLYFSTQSQYPHPDASGYNPSLNRIWYINQDATGGTATALTLTGLPGGHHFYPGDMTFDASTRQLYVESEEVDGVADDVIFVFQLNAAGTSASLIRTITPSPALTSGASNIEGMTFTYTPVIAALSSTSAHASEGGGTTVVLANAPTITDRDGAQMRSATVQITGNLDAAGDNLGVGAAKQISGTVAGTSISLSWNAATGTLTLTGRDTLAHYQDVLAAVRYWTTADLSSSSTRTITWTVNDGTPDLSAASSNTGSTSLTVDPITNSAPVATGTAALNAVNEDTANPAGATVATVFGPHFSDANGNTLAGVAISVNNTTGAEGVWQYHNGVSWTTIGVQSESSALVLAAGTLLRFLPAANFNGAPPTLEVYLIDSSGGAVTTGSLLNVTTNGGATPYSDTTVTLTTSVTAVNDSPQVTLANNVSATEQTAARLLSTVTVADTDLDAFNGGQGDYAGASFVVRRNGGANTVDSFTFDTTGASFTVSGSNLQSGGLTFATFAVVNGQLTISFTSTGTAATSALVDDVIQHITYTNTSDAPPASVILFYQIVDGGANGSQGGVSNLQSNSGVLVNISHQNDTHTGGAAIIGTAAEDNVLTAVSTISDPDGIGTLHYQWQHDVGAGFVNVGSDQSIYTLGDGDIGGVVRVVIYYTDAYGTVESSTSDATAAISATDDAPTGGVSITGTLTEDQVLTADSSTLSDPDGLGTLHYDWQRDTGSGFVSIGAADQVTYTLGDADVGAVVRVVVSYTDGQGFSNSVTSPGAGAISGVNDAHTGGASIVGTSTENQVLTAVSTLADNDGLGTLHYDWQRDTGGGFVSTGAADQATYTLGDADVGGVVRVVISYTDAQGFSESATSASTGMIANVNDVHTGGVSVTGTTTEDQVLTADTSTLSDNDGLGTLHYQWQRDTGDGYVNVGADQATYTLGDADVGSVVRVIVSYVDQRGTVEALVSAGSSAIAAVNDPHTGGASISGTATEDQTLTAVSTLADTDGLGTLHYDWQRDTGGGFISIGAADQATYTLGDADVGGVVRVVISYTDGQGFSESATSASTGAIANNNDAPVGGVSITGTATEDQVLTADTSTLSDNDGTGTLHYQWQRDTGAGFVNVGADQATYTLGDADVGGVVRVIVSYTDGYGTVESAVSAGSAVVGGVNDPHAGGVSITGTQTEDQILTAVSTLSDADGLGTLHYQWQRDTGGGYVNVGADQATYTLGDGDVGGVVRVIVSYTDGQGFAESSTSAGTGVIANVNDAPTGGAAISGTATEDQTLTAVSTLADADGLGTLHYQWQRDTGGGYVNVGTDQATYTLGDADVGGVVRVVIYYTDGHGTVEASVSAGTAAVANIDDAAIARNDAVSTTESLIGSGSLFANNGSGADSDIDGPALSIAAVNGSAANVGTQILLASGALLTVNANGTYSYNPNGAFNHLPGAGSGSVNTATDTFTYTLAGGNTATVTVTINGEGSPSGDVLVGGSGNDTQTGGGGNDTIVGGAGNDAINGGAGTDTVSYSTAGGGVIVRLNHGDAPNDGFGGTDTITGVENVTGSSFNDILTGSGVDNVLIGGGGYDVLLGLNGNDVLIGGSGAANELYGGAGNDTYFVTANDTIIEAGGQGIDTVITTQTSFRLAANVERLFFNGAGNATLIGNAEDNFIVGGAGNDIIDGGAGYDVLIGGDGNDSLGGGSGAANELYGGLGNDTYRVDANDTIIELAGQGTDTVLTTLTSFGLTANVENLSYTGTSNFVGRGNALDNVINGRSGNDILTGGGGNDTLNGGDGIDVAVLSGVAANYTVTHVSGSTWTITDNTPGRDGVDTITNIERLSFSDGTFRVLTPPAAPALAPVLTDKETIEGPQVLPGVTDDGFLLDKAGDAPQVLPALVDDAPLTLPGIDDLVDGARFTGHSLIDPMAPTAEELLHTPDATPPSHNDWLL
jgi:Ca2+-binding RTX toxin-like protein